MIDDSLLKNYNIGKDGFSWWLGQVCEAETWADNYPCMPVDYIDDLPGFKRRVKVSILGWHTSDKNELKNHELPWAYCLLPVTAGGGAGGSSESLNLTGGEWVFGFFLDGEDGQQPIIIGVLDKSTQEDFRTSVPKHERYKPFSGFTNHRVAPLTDMKKDATVKRKNVGGANVKEGNTGVQRTRTKPEEAVQLEQGAKGDVRPKAEKTRYDNGKATGGMCSADNSPTNDPFEIADRAMKRLSMIKTWIKEHNGVEIDGSMNKLAEGLLEKEEKKASFDMAVAQKTHLNKMQAAVQEASSKMMSNFSTFGKLMDMGKAKMSNAKATQSMIGQFNGIASQLPISAADFVKNSSNKLISQPPCVIESYTGAAMGQNIAAIDGAMNKMMGPVNDMLSMATSGDFPPDIGNTINGLLTGGLNAFGGISIDMDGIASFTSSYKKLMKGEKSIPPPKIKCFNIWDGGHGEGPSQIKMGNVLENVAAAVPGNPALVAGSSNFLNKNSLFSTAFSADNFSMDSLGGLGGITDTLSKAKNLSGYGNFPGTTGDSILNLAKTYLEEGNTLDAAVVGAEKLFPGGGDFIKTAFQNQTEGQRVAGGGSCDETGPTLNGPPQIKIFGGNGNGATANAVIGPMGNLLAVELTRPGKGFTSPPFAVVSDPSGKGKGAVVKVILDYAQEIVDTVLTGGTVAATGIALTKYIRSYPIKSIDVIEPGTGYMSRPDGSVGGNGFTFAEKGNTTVKDREGNYYSFEPGTGIKVPPGSTVYFPAGTTAMLPTNAVKTNGEPLTDTKGSNIVNYAALRMMHDFDTSVGKIIPGPQGAEGTGKPGFGKGNDYKLAKEQGYSDADIRFFLEGDPARGQQSYFLSRMNGAIGQNMQKLLDDPTWGQLPVMNSAGKKPGKIKSIQVNIKKGYKGFAKVTDGSRLGAGPILSLRDAVTDRKISNILEFQTGNWLNQNANLEGNTDILQLFRDQELRAINGTPIEEFGKFGTAGIRSWEQTRQKVGADTDVSGGGQRYNINGEKYRTLDPWRADIPDGTRLTFRGCYNHNTVLNAEQLADPYNLQKNNYRYFIYDYEVEVYSTAQGYSYAAGETDPVKTKWYKLIGIKFVTGTEDWFNGETVNKRCRDKAGRLYEMYITVCTYDDEQAQAIGGGLATNSEVQEIIRTPLPCNPEIIKDEYADYQKVRWYREDIKGGIPDEKGDKYGEDWGHMPGSERNELVRQIVKIYNSFGDKEREWAYKYGESGKQGRMYVDRPGLHKWINDYFKWLDKLKLGQTCDHDETIVPQTVPGFNGPGVYLDLRGVTGLQTIQFREVVDSSLTHHKLDIPGIATISEEGLWLWDLGVQRDPIFGIPIGFSVPPSTSMVVNDILGGRIYGPITSSTAAGVWAGTEKLFPGIIAAAQAAAGTSNMWDPTPWVGKGPSSIVMLEEAAPDTPFFMTGTVDAVGEVAKAAVPPEIVPSSSPNYSAFGLMTSLGKFVRLDAAPVGGPPKKKRVSKTTVPLSEEDYKKYRYDLNQKPEPRAWACVKKFIYEEAEERFDDEGMIWKETTYCDWAREYVDEVRTAFRPTTTIGYDLPCGGEITAPSETPTEPVVTSDTKIVKPKQTVINSTGSGYDPDTDNISIGGEDVPFEVDPEGRIVKVGVPNIIVDDYPPVIINTQYGAGADIETILEVLPLPTDGDITLPTDEDLLPLKMVEVIDCVGKNIFIKEN